MKLLITGGAGFLGRYFWDRLRDSGHRLTILDLRPPLWPEADDVDYVQGDVRDPDAVQSALRGCDAVLHLAAAHHDFGIAASTYHSVNHGSAEVLCRAMDQLGVRKTCFFSSVAVYGAAPEPRHEDTPCQPATPYGESKLAAERVFRRWVDKGEGRSALIIRPTAVFGPHNFANMYTLIRQIDRGRFVRVGEGMNYKSLCYVENIVGATLHLWEMPDRTPWDVYNYVDKPDLTSREISDAVCRALGRSGFRFSVPLQVALMAALPFDLMTSLTGRDLGISTSRIEKFATSQSVFEADKIAATGYRPRVSLLDGIARMVEWYRTEGRVMTAVRHLPPPEIAAEDM